MSCTSNTCTLSSEVRRPVGPGCQVIRMVATILVRRLNELVEGATDRNQSAVDEFALEEIKRLARTSDLALRATYDILLTRLKQSHAQARMLGEHHGGLWHP